MLRASRGLTIERIRAGRALRCALFFMLAGLTAAIVLGILAAGQADAIFRAFSPVQPVEPHRRRRPPRGTPTRTSSPTARACRCRLSGTPDTVTYAAPDLLRAAGRPDRARVGHPARLAARRRDRLGRPPGPRARSASQPAPGADGHLTVVSADRRTAWDFLGCTQAGPMGYVGEGDRPVEPERPRLLDARTTRPRPAAPARR